MAYESDNAYFRDPTGQIRAHPDLVPVVLEGVRRYTTGLHGYGDLAKWADAEGYRTPSGRRLSREWWRNTLRNPMCAGYLIYRRKKGKGHELHKASFEGFMSLELFQEVQRVRTSKMRRPGERPSYQTYILSGATCPCGAKITATTGHRLRCRVASQHAGCDKPSFRAETPGCRVRSPCRRATRSSSRRSSARS